MGLLGSAPLLYFFEKGCRRNLKFSMGRKGVRVVPAVLEGPKLTQGFDVRDLVDELHLFHPHVVL